MNKNFKLFFKCILSNENYSFINNLGNNLKNTNVFLTTRSLYYVVLYFRFSSLFYSTQLVDIFSYEIPRSEKGYYLSKAFSTKKTISSIVVYNFHVLNTQDRFFLFFSPNSILIQNDKPLSLNTTLSSITELFFAANWLEREVSELHAITFNGKKDIRNLMLQYGDSTAPFQKSFPSIGVKELFYNPVKDTLVQNPVTVQI